MNLSCLCCWTAVVNDENVNSQTGIVNFNKPIVIYRTSQPVCVLFNNKTGDPNSFVKEIVFTNLIRIVIC